ncbi:murein biosynthesis integral membrane protein MurJ [Salinibacterium sp. SYSU T00001]|uniref:murein biosynthesis integral membrane protein MurJ n=1 Tax=Homoserinimonas sedimenticola TaxID=2986805 RepID=UPI0022367FE2|nr:murein biosynthesis integral membrane protein MurJ [Salinibacterium sedimenticola]MCW4385796.1 murein biosynthesis integral membrane protein MurJ [Salinibacterium sedimenticola]
MTATDAEESGNLRRSSALLASGTIVSRVLGFIKAIVLAQTIGQTGAAAADAFGIANQLPNNIYALIAGGVLGAVLVPQIVRASSNADEGAAFINKLVTLGIAGFVGITLIATLAAPLLIHLYAQQAASDGGEGFSARGIALATAFAYWCLPQIFFYALYSLLGEVLNARGAFGPFAWAPALNNVVAIAGLVLFQLFFGGAETNSAVEVWTTERIVLLAGTATLGIATQALVLLFFWRRAGIRYRPDFQWRGVGLARTGRTAGWIFAMILVTQLAGIVQVNVASLAAGAGAGVATLQNSWLIFMLPHSVIAVSIATVFFTRMSGNAHEGDLDAVKTDVSASLRSIGLIVSLAAVTLIVVAAPFARMFEREHEDVLAMAAVIAMYMVGLVPFSAVFVLQRTFYALEDTRTVFFIEVVKSALFVAGFVACSTLPVEWIGVGIAAVSSLTFLLQFLMTFAVLRRRLGGFGGRTLLVRHAEYLLAAGVASAVGAGVLLLLGGLSADGFALANAVTAIVTMAAVGVPMAIVYAGVLALLRNPDLLLVRDLVLRRIRRS